MISRNINENRSLAWFNSCGKIILEAEQIITRDALELTSEYTIDINRVKFEKINEYTYYLPRKITIEYDSDEDFEIVMGNYVDTLSYEESKVIYSLQEGDDFSTIVLRPIGGNSVSVNNLKIVIEPLTKRIPMDNYGEKQFAIINSITQKLYTFKKELWYAYSFGLPLFEKYKTKVAIDAFVAQVVTSQEGVKDVAEFNSKVEKGNYICDLKINSVYGPISISL